MVSAPGGSGLANAPFPAHHDVPGAVRIGGDPRESSTSRLQPPSSMGKALLTQAPRGHQESPGAARAPALPCLAPLPGPASHRTPPALTSFCSSLERSGRGSTWEDTPGVGASREETCSTCGEENNQRERPQKVAGKKVSCPPRRPRWAQGGGELRQAARQCRGLALGWARRWLAGNALSCAGFSLHPPNYLLPSTFRLSPAAPPPPGAPCGGPLWPQAGWPATCRHCPSAADPVGTPGPSSPIPACGHPAMVDVMMLGDHRAGCLWVAASPSSLGRVPGLDGTHQAGYGEHPMGMSHVLSPRWVSGVGPEWGRPVVCAHLAAGQVGRVPRGLRPLERKVG